MQQQVEAHSLLQSAQSHAGTIQSFNVYKSAKLALQRYEFCDSELQKVLYRTRRISISNVSFKLNAISDVDLHFSQLS